MKSSSTIGLILASMLLVPFSGVAFTDHENATLSENLTNMTQPENLPYMVTNVNTNTITIQNNSLNIILIGNMTEVINMNMLQNETNATKNTAKPQK
ncbi:Uncharacterised protein [uncultured archaeon]|nr:Uncharacterised protein [uncultured archaeon]